MPLKGRETTSLRTRTPQAMVIKVTLTKDQTRKQRNFEHKDKQIFTNHKDH